MKSKALLARQSRPQLQVSRAEGSFLFDQHGKKYIDFVMGWCVGNLGWGHPELEKWARRFKGPDYVYPGYDYRPWEELAKLLLSIAPRNLARCFRATGGSEAVDIALQAAMVHTGRRGLMSLEEAYHGNSIAGLSVGEGDYLRDCHKIAPPLDAKALAKIERRLASRRIAAFIMEPVSINLGVLIPSRSFMRELQRLCRRYGTLLILDEVACGFGRTGRLFAAEHYELEPDLMCIAKAVTGGTGGMGAVLASAAVAKSMEEEGTFYSTYGWHPRSVDLAIATVRLIARDRKRLLENVEKISALFSARLAPLDFESRIQGLAIALDVGDGKYAAKVQERCQDRGLLVNNEESLLLMLPALNIDRATAEKGLDILERAL
jgi:adenosylmethionine-8-amino-7-oxononanoate aminotransferase